MARRVGGFGATLDPFGGSRGGLGRYNVTGETIASLEAYEAYVVATAWANGTASDEEYLASLQRMVDISPEGSRDRVAAENRLGDAVYSIGRNAIARDVNNANTLTERVDALARMLEYDRTRLTQMEPGNQAYRDQQDRIAATQGDIRQSKYSDLVTKVNRGQASTADLIRMAERFVDDAAGQPDRDEWQEAVVSLNDRQLDEKISDGYQAYQHNRMSGATLLGLITARMAGMDPQSSAYKELANQAEDLRQRVKTDDRVKAEAVMQGKRSAGKVSDKAFLGYLQDEYDNTEPGTSERLQAGNRLKEYTFSLAEDKLRYDVTKGKKPVSALISFYKSARNGMNPGSERYRTLTLAIDSLSKGGYGGGGGGGRSGGGGGRSSGGIDLGPKLMEGTGALVDYLGGPKPPKDLGDLFRIDVTSSTSKKWWDNNLRSVVDAFQRGDRTWTYYDKRGNAYALPFTPDIMAQFDVMNVNYIHNGLAQADNAKDAQRWTGLLITGTDALRRRGGQYTMDVYQRTWTDLERAKEQALAGGRFAEYANLVNEQATMTRSILGLGPDDLFDPNLSTNPFLTESQRADIAMDLSRLMPADLDPDSPYFNQGGDKVLAMMQDGSIAVERSPTGEFTNAVLDPRRGYLVQTKSGVEIVPFDMDAVGGAVYDEASETMIPSYLRTTVGIIIRVGGEDQPVRAAWTADSTRLPVYGARGLTTSSAARGQPIPGSQSEMMERFVVDGQNVTIPLRSFNTYEGTKTVTWVSLDGVTWVRTVHGEGVAPRVVLKSGVTYEEGKWMEGGKEVTDLSTIAHWWNGGDSARSGEAYGFGAPGVKLTTRVMGAPGEENEGFIDSRSPGVVMSEINETRARYEEREGLGRLIKRRTDLDADELVGTATPGGGPKTGGYRKGEVLPEPNVAADAFAAQTSRATSEAKIRALRTMAGASKDDLFTAGELVATHDRGKGEMLAAVSRSRQLAPVVRREIGVKPKPKPVLTPPPTPSLVPTQVARLNLSKLKGGVKPPPLPPAKKKAPTSTKPAPKPATPTPKTDLADYAKSLNTRGR